MTAPVPMHAEATSDPLVARWVVPPGTLAVLGQIEDAPGRLGALLAAGEMARVSVEPSGVLVTLPAGSSWSEAGAVVAEALAEALLSPMEWRPAVAASEEDLLLAALREVIDGRVGDFIRSHGGDVAVESVDGCCASVRMRGACEHCPALGFTLHARLETAVRERFPALTELRARA